MCWIIVSPDCVCVTMPLSGTDLVCCCATVLISEAMLFLLHNKLGIACHSIGFGYLVGWLSGFCNLVVFFPRWIALSDFMLDVLTILHQKVDPPLVASV